MAAPISYVELPRPLWSSGPTATNPIVDPSGGRATAAAIADAKLTIVPGMGHHLAPGLTNRLVDLISLRTATDS